MNKQNKHLSTEDLTLHAAKSGGLQIDYRMYHDPIYRSWMIGDFLRELKSRSIFWILIPIVLLLFFLTGSVYFIASLE